MTAPATQLPLTLGIFGDEASEPADCKMAPLLSVLIPMRTKNPLNGSQGRTLNGRRAREAGRAAQRKHTWANMCAEGGFNLKKPLPSLTITLTRISPGRVSDEAIAATLKAVRDGVADWLGIDDDDPRLTWIYRQEKGAAKRKGKPAEYAVRVEVE
jgi:hypothetical protein